LADIYVLDSNVLLTDPQAIYQFPEAEVVIPGVVIEEIDAKKNGGDGTAYNARQVARQLDFLRQQGSLHQPTPLGNGGLLRVELNHRSLDLLLDPEIPLVTITGRAGTDKTLLALAGHVMLIKGERSPLSKLAADTL
jgi:PhoH-like ATPase